jgi:hypothetical protein
VDLLRGLNAARSSALKSSGCSQEAKWRSPAAYRGDPLAERENVNDFSQGVPLSKLQPLVRYWGTNYGKFDRPGGDCLSKSAHFAPACFEHLANYIHNSDPGPKLASTPCLNSHDCCGERVRSCAGFWSPG